MSNDRITKVHGRLSKEVLCGWRYSFVLGSSVWCKPTRSLCIFSSLSQLLLSSPSSQTWMSPKVLPFALSFSHWRLLHHLSSITGHEDHCCSYCVLPCHTLQFDITSSLSLDFSTQDISHIFQVLHDWNRNHCLPTYKTLSLFLLQLSEQNQYPASHPSQIPMLMSDSSFSPIPCISGREGINESH